MDEGLSEEALKRVYAIRDQYIEGEAPIIVTSLFKGPFQSTPWLTSNNSNHNEAQSNDNTIGTLDSEKTIPYDTFGTVKTPSYEENTTTTITANTSTTSVTTTTTTTTTLPEMKKEYE
ncbi:unnamed protein product [Cunninghamella blakesleeana]